VAAVGGASRARRLVARLVLASTALVCAAVLAELFWRAFRTAGYGPTTNPRYVVHDPLLGWRYRPGARVRHATEDFDVEVAIGALGFREQASLPSRAPEVLVLGDSLAFGWGVEGDRTFSALLEGGLGCSVWNLGVSGYGTDQELLLLRERPFAEGLAFPLAPRVVLALFCPNDVEEVARPVMYGHAKPIFVGPPSAPVLSNVPVPCSWIEQVSHLYRSVHRHLVEALAEPLGPSELVRARELVAWLYERMADEARDMGAILVVASEGESWLTDALEHSGILHLELEGVLGESARAGGAVVFTHDPHWNARGHAAVAQALGSFLRERGLLQ
jgi:hypothetical protein